MTREEEIKQAAENNLDVSIYTPKDCEMLKETFYIGAKWADEHLNLERLWHDASEEPKGTYIVLCDVLDNRQWIVERFYIDMAYATWKDFAEAISVRRWAYVSDLLPKGGEK